MEFNINEYISKIVNGNWSELNFQNRFEGILAIQILNKILEFVDEGNQLDYKENLSYKEKLGKIACHFSNHNGGCIVFGIKENILTKEREKKGISNSLPQFRERVSNKFRTICQPAPKIKIIDLSIDVNKNFVIVSFSPISKEAEPISYKGKYYKRVGEATIPDNYIDIARNFPNSLISQLLKSFHIYTQDDLDILWKRINHFNYNQKIVIENLLDIEKENIDLLSRKDNIIIHGFRGSGKTTLTYKILNFILKRFSKNSTLILLPKENVELIDISNINLKINIVVVWDDIPSSLKSNITHNIMKNIKQISQLSRQEKVVFKILGNYRNEDIKILIESGILTDQFFMDTFFIETKVLDNNKLIREALKLFLIAFKLNLKSEEELKLNLLTNKINKNPTIGYLVSLLNFIKYYYDTKIIKDISLDFIGNLPSNLDSVWKNNYSLLDMQSKKILHSIRLLFEFNQSLKINIVKFLFLNYFEGEELIFRDRINDLIQLGWFSLSNDNLLIWDAKIESIPLETKQDIDSKLFSHLIDIIKSSIVNIDKIYAVNWINNIAQKIVLNSRTQSEIRRSLELYEYSNELVENAWSYFGIALNYQTLFEINTKGNLLEYINFIEDAIEFYKIADTLNPGSFPILNNLGSCYQKIAKTKHISERRDLLQKAIEYYNLAKQVSPNSPVVYINEANILFDISVIDLQEDVLKDWKELDERSNEILKLTQKANNLLPFFMIINKKETIRYESHILELEGRIFSAKGNSLKETIYYEKAEKYFLNAFKLNEKLFHVFLGIARVNYNKSMLSNFKDKDSIHKALSFLIKHAEFMGEETIENYVLKLRCKHALLVGKLRKDVLQGMISIDKELINLYKKKPIYTRDSAILVFWMQFRSEITRNSPLIKIRKKYIIKYVDTSLLYLSIYPFENEIKEFESSLLELIQLIPLNGLKNKIIRKVRYFSRRNSNIYSINQTTKLIAKLNNFKYCNIFQLIRQLILKFLLERR